jgi:hypothetical protein
VIRRPFTFRPHVCRRGRGACRAAASPFQCLSTLAPRWCLGYLQGMTRTKQASGTLLTLSRTFANYSLRLRSKETCVAGNNRD